MSIRELGSEGVLFVKMTAGKGSNVNSYLLPDRQKARSSSACLQRAPGGQEIQMLLQVQLMPGSLRSTAASRLLILIFCTELDHAIARTDNRSPDGAMSGLDLAIICLQAMIKSMQLHMHRKYRSAMSSSRRGTRTAKDAACSQHFKTCSMKSTCSRF